MLEHDLILLYNVIEFPLWNIESVILFHYEILKCDLFLLLKVGM